MARETLPLLGVSQVFGPAFTGGATGSYDTSGAKREYSINLTGDVLSHKILGTVKIAKGSVITKAYLRVTEAFNLATSSVVKVGTKTAEATNGASITEAQLEATGYVDLTSTLAGTWDAEVPLAADTLIGVAFSAGSVTDKAVGKAVLVIEAVRVIA